MSMPYIRQVERFLAVAEAGSIQKAARQLNISQPSLTKAIAGIEESFGCQLFERTSRGIRLTAVGEILQARSRVMLREGMLAREQIADLVAGRSGLVRISAGTAWGYCFMPSIIAELQGRFPDLKVELDIGITSLALRQLLAGETDIVVGSLDDARREGDWAQHQGIAHDKLLKITFGAACGADNPLAQRAVVDLAEFAKMPMVIYQRDEYLMSMVMAEFDAANPGGLNIAVRTRSLLAAMELVKTGRYVVSMAEPFLRKFSSPHIRVLNLATPLPSFQSGVIFRESLRYTDWFPWLLGRLRAVAHTWPQSSPLTTPPDD